MRKSDGRMRFSFRPCFSKWVNKNNIPSFSAYEILISNNLSPSLFFPIHSFKPNYPTANTLLPKLATRLIINSFSGSKSPPTIRDSFLVLKLNPIYFHHKLPRLHYFPLYDVIPLAASANLSSLITISKVFENVSSWERISGMSNRRETNIWLSSSDWGSITYSTWRV